MIKSMTGFGHAEQSTDDYIIKIQIKSVNHRYSDFSIKAPKYYSFLEEKIRQAASAAIARGKVEIGVSLERRESDDKTITLDHKAAQSYIAALRELNQYQVTDDLTMSALAHLEDIFHIEYAAPDEAQIAALVLSVFHTALDDFMQMRISEGARLEESIRQHLRTILREVEAVEQRSPACIDAYRNRLYAKLQEVLNGVIPDDNRILTEAAIYADKTSVDEETVRLRSHVNAFEQALTAGSPIGKKLDFIVQEMNREANTIGSKANDYALAQHVVELKTTIEKIREQIQNIE